MVPLGVWELPVFGVLFTGLAEAAGESVASNCLLYEVVGAILLLLLLLYLAIFFFVVWSLVRTERLLWVPTPWTQRKVMARAQFRQRNSGTCLTWFTSVYQACIVLNDRGRWLPKQNDDTRIERLAALFDSYHGYAWFFGFWGMFKAMVICVVIASIFDPITNAVTVTVLTWADLFASLTLMPDSALSAAFQNTYKISMSAALVSTVLARVRGWIPPGLYDLLFLLLSVFSLIPATIQSASNQLGALVGGLRSVLGCVGTVKLGSSLAHARTACMAILCACWADDAAHTAAMRAADKANEDDPGMRRMASTEQAYGFNQNTAIGRTTSEASTTMLLAIRRSSSGLPTQANDDDHGMMRLAASTEQARSSPDRDIGIGRTPSESSTAMLLLRSESSYSLRGGSASTWQAQSPSIFPQRTASYATGLTFVTAIAPEVAREEANLEADLGFWTGKEPTDQLPSAEEGAPAARVWSLSHALRSGDGAPSPLAGSPSPIPAPIPAPSSPIPTPLRMDPGRLPCQPSSVNRGSKLVPVEQGPPGPSEPADSAYVAPWHHPAPTARALLNFASPHGNLSPGLAIGAPVDHSSQRLSARSQDTPATLLAEQITSLRRQRLSPPLAGALPPPAGSLLELHGDACAKGRAPPPPHWHGPAAAAPAAHLTPRHASLEVHCDVRPLSAAQRRRRSSVCSAISNGPPPSLQRDFPDW